jgi:uncharacterized protein YbjT (DUF2867 family)
MTSTPRTSLILGGTGRTGSLVASTLTERGQSTRTAARTGADVAFDWDDPATYSAALDSVDRLYLVTPVLRVTYAEQVGAFLDLAEAAGVRHVTYLSTYRAEHAPPEVDIWAVELDLAARKNLTHTILRPAWVMQNFADYHLPIIDGAITVPSGGEAEAFVDAADIAAVAVETLLHPQDHAGAHYTLTGPQDLTFDEVAQTIATVTGRPVTYRDIESEAWIAGAIAAGLVPADYAVMLRWLTATIISGNGSKPTADVEKVTGRPPTLFRDFVRRHLPAFTAN